MANNNGTPVRKEDTPDKLAYAEGKPVKNFIFANDYNGLMDMIRALWALMIVDPTLFHPDSKIDLGTITGSFIDYINTHAPHIFLEPCFVVYKIGEVEYVQAFVGYGGTYGTGQLQVSANMFVLLNTSDQPQPTLPARRIWHGELTATIFTHAKNTLGYNVTAAQVGEYVKTNIPYFPTLVVTFHDQYLFNLEGYEGAYMKQIYTELGGFLAFKNVITTAENEQIDGGEFSGCIVTIEQL